jgi:AbrB family looped-hinge helix DNA binding protein
MIEITEVVKVTDKGQITIPAKIRQTENIKPQQMLFAMDIEGFIVLTKLKEDPIKEFVSTLKNITGNADTKKLRQIRDEAEKLTNQKIGRWR